MPAIVQSLVSKQGLPINGGALIITKPDTVKLSLDTTLDVPLPVNLDETVLHLYNKDTQPFSPFLDVTLPAQHVKGKTNIDIVNQTEPVINRTEAVKWLGNVVDNDKVDISIKSSLTVRLGALNSNPTLDKTVELPGLRKLSGMGISSLKLNIGAAKGANNAEGTMIIPNWGVLDLFLGDVTFDLLSADLKLGSVMLPGLTLNRGNNTCSFAGILEIPTIVANIGPVLKAQAQYIKDGNLMLGARASSVTLNGEHISIIEEVLMPRTILFPVSIVSLLVDVVGGIIPGGGNGTDIISNVVGVLGNNTLVQDALNNFNHTNAKHGKTTTQSQTKKAKRNSPDNLMWNLLKVAIKMKANSRLEL